MAEGVLGRAIAVLLEGAEGRFYVQLPRELKAEALALAAERNARATNSAIVVATGIVPSDPEWVVPPPQLLAWRTAEDRAFVILGGAVEPDSSFATSAVPFLTSSFPGSGGGTCTPAEFASQCVAEALSKARADEGAIDTFRGAAPWAFKLLGMGLQDNPRPTKDWGQSLLEAWATVLSQLEDGAMASPLPLRPWDAWELIRLCGFPRPLLGSDRIQSPPGYLEVDDAKLEAVANVWREFVDEYVRTSEVSILLERLAATSPIPNSPRWRTLEWGEAARAAQRFSATPPEIGRVLFRRDGALRDPAPNSLESWHAVTSEDLKAALAVASEGPRLAPGRGFLPLAGDDGAWLVDTRAAHTGHRTKGMSDRVELSLELSVEGLRPTLTQASAQDGDHIIVGASTTVRPKAGIDVTVAADGLSVAAGRLRVTLGAELDVKARTTKAVRWAPTRRLVLDVRVQDVVGGKPQPVREVSLVVQVVLPNPYWPTVVATAFDTLPVSPAADVHFDIQDGAFAPAESPELAVERPGSARIIAYDGRWNVSAHAFSDMGDFGYSGEAEPSTLDGFDFAAVARLADDAVITWDAGEASLEVTVVRVEEQTVALPTNPLRRERAQGPLGEPSRAQREAPLGRFQTAIAKPLAAQAWNADSLGQLVIPSGIGDLPGDLHFGRVPTAIADAAGPWPGLGSGPSESLATTPEWVRFIEAALAVAAPALQAGTLDWLSSMDLSAVEPAKVRTYLAAHRQLVAVAAEGVDKFWARYPFSVFLVQGGRGPDSGTLQAIFLSPMHPVRLGWLYSAQCHSEALDDHRRLLGLIDGWNFPAVGEAPTNGGMPLKLVALPLDPGEDGDLAAWGALVPISQHGIVRPPLHGAGARLPWGGRSGLNKQVVLQSLDDYRRAHPFLSSLQVELRTAVPAPRSTEVDLAVLEWTSKNAEDLGGAVRVLDSARRLGEPPDRDSLPPRPATVPRGRFAWSILGADERASGPVDVAFVENAAPFTHVVEGRPLAPSPPLPVRRFSLAEAAEDQVDYHHASASEDLLGLTQLLEFVEPVLPSTRIVTTEGSIQAGPEVRWEVIGDINMEPSQMARVAAASGMGKQLWEWRPGWVDNRAGSVRGAHYVLAKAPRSLVAALERNLGLSEDKASELLAELGSRGVGLATLRRPGTTQESEAAGLFYAARLLTGYGECPIPPTWLGENCFAGLVPLDPIEGVMRALASDDQSETRADLGLIVLRATPGKPAALKIIPVECKHRGSASDAAASPSATERERARRQAISSADRLRGFQQQVREASGLASLLQASGRLQAFAALVDLAMKFGPDEPSIEARSKAIQDIVDGEATLEVGDGLVVWSHGGRDAPGLTPLTISVTDKVAEAVFVPAAAAPFAWLGSAVEDRHASVRADLDRFLAPILGISDGAPLHKGLRDELRRALGLVEGDEDGDGTPPAGDGTPPSPDDADEGGAAIVVPAEAAAIDDDGVVPADAHTAAQLATPEEAARQAPAAQPPRKEEVPGEPPKTYSRPDLFLGADDSDRFSTIGKIASSGQVVALDLDHPKAVGVFGYMGSGKSYLLGNLIESAATPLPGLNELASPLSVVVFNYRRNAADRFELGSLSAPNDEPADVTRLKEEFGASPGRVSDLRILCLPGEMKGREEEYEGATASELYFRPSSLDVEDWELLMGEPGSDAVFARTIRTSLQDLRRRGEITIEAVREHLAERLQKGSLAAAELRLENVERIVSAERGVDFAELLAPGRVLVIDLRQPMFNRDDAMKLILVCASQIAKQRTAFNKLVVFDEAHEYMTEEFGERFDARIRYMRHEGSSYIFATQDVASVPTEIRRHLGTNFVFSLETRDNINDMSKAAPEFAGLQLQHLAPGTCYVTSSKSTGNLFRAPRLVRVRPRATRHGGKSRIFHQNG